MRLASLPFPKIKALLQEGAIALWPTGSTEAHGPHLPLDTDVLIATETCTRAVASLQEKTGLHALVLPPLAFTVTEFASPFSGTISISKQTASAYVQEVLQSAAQQGFKAICLVNAHLEPAHRFALRDAVKAARQTAQCPLTIADPCDKRWVPTLTEEFKSGSCHAGQYESSLVMAHDAQKLDEAKRAQLSSVEIDLVAQMTAKKRTFLEMGADQAYFGTPQNASVEEGNWTYSRLVDMVCTMVEEALRTDDA